MLRSNLTQKLVWVYLSDHSQTHYVQDPSGLRGSYRGLYTDRFICTMGLSDSWTNKDHLLESTFGKAYQEPCVDHQGFLVVGGKNLLSGFVEIQKLLKFGVAFCTVRVVGVLESEHSMSFSSSKCVCITLNSFIVYLWQPKGMRWENWKVTFNELFKDK